MTCINYRSKQKKKKKELAHTSQVISSPNPEVAGIMGSYVSRVACVTMGVEPPSTWGWIQSIMKKYEGYS